MGKDLKNDLKHFCRIGDLDMVKYLLFNNIDEETRNEIIHCDNERLLSNAIYSNQFDIVKYLHELGADLHYHTCDDEYSSALYDIIINERHWNIEMLKYLIDNGCKDLHCYYGWEDDYNLYMISISSGSVEWMELIQGKISDRILFKDDIEKYIKKAFLLGHLNIVNYLEITYRNYFDYTEKYSYCYGYSNNLIKDSLESAINYDHLHVIKYLACRSLIKDIDNKYYLLTDAIIKTRYEIVKYLCELGFDINIWF